MKRVIPFLPWIGALLLIAVALLCYESELLWKVQQYNLFLDTSLYFHEQMLVPGGGARRFPVLCQLLFRPVLLPPLVRRADALWLVAVVDVAHQAHVPHC